MATISFDREIRLKEGDIDRFLDVIEKQPDYKWEYIDIDAEMKESRRLLKKYYSHRN